MCVSGHDVAVGDGLLGEGGREGALKRLEAKGVHVGHRERLDRSLVREGKAEAKTEGVIGQRKTARPGQHEYMGAIPLGS